MSTRKRFAAVAAALLSIAIISTPANAEEILNGWVSEGESWYYYDQGTKVTGWKSFDTDTGTKYYYFSESGKMATGWRAIDDYWYWFRDGGSMVTGWREIDGSWYWFGSGGKMATGWREIDGHYFYLGDSGRMRTGWQEIDGCWYVFGDSGRMRTGWYRDSGYWYYLNPQNGKMLSGFVEVEGERYLLSSSGKMVTGWREVEGKWYWFDGSGAMAIGWQEIDGAWWLFTNSGPLSEDTGWYSEDGDWYYSEKGRFATNCWRKISGYWYRFGADARLYVGKSFKADGKTWLADSSGALVSGKGWKWVEGGYRYFNSDGSLRTGWLESSPSWGTWFYLDPDNDGKMVTGWKKIDGRWSYFSPTEGNWAGYEVSPNDAYRRAGGIWSPTNNLILVDKGDHQVFCFVWKNGGWSLDRQFFCTIGASNTPTPSGTTRLMGGYYSFGHGYTCYYFREFRVGGYGFHTRKYKPGSHSEFVDGRLGVNVSMGCIRLEDDNARYIYNLPYGTTVHIYN